MVNSNVDNICTICCEHDDVMWAQVLYGMRHAATRAGHEVCEMPGLYCENWNLLCTWLSLVMSMMVSFCAVLFPTRCLG